MWGIGASLDVKDEGRGEIPESGFNDCTSFFFFFWGGGADDFVCRAEEDLLDFDLSAESRIGD